jgi:hypothetical protein
MAEVAMNELTRDVESQFGCPAVLIRAVLVREFHKGRIVWQGTVHVFDLKGHSEADRAYALSSPAQESGEPGATSVFRLAAPVPVGDPAESADRHGPAINSI